MSLNENNNDKLEDTTVSIDDDPTAKASRGNAAPIKNWLLNTLYGDISVDEFKKFGLLGLIFLFIIGSYWLLRPLKDAVFFTVVGGKQYQPYAKMLSVVVVVMVVMIYSKLVDIFSREKLFYVVMGFFACAYWILALLLNHPTIGLQNEEPSPYRLVGWITYFTVECYGSITVSMFWSFVASCTQSSSARRGYSLIVGGAQIGSIMGPLLAANAQTLGVVPLFFLAGACAIGVGLFVRLFVTVLPMNVNQSENDNQLTYDTKDGANTAQTTSKTTLQKRSGFFDGLILIGKHPYITGIALVSTLNEVVATITDYQMKVLAHDTSANTAELASFLGTFGMAVNSLALVAALVGTSYALRRFGVRVCLLAYPIAVAGACSILFFFANSEPLTLLRVFFFVMVLTKGLSYALNNPSKEILYIPTSKDVKYKAKGWIDLFGMRSAKAIGSTATTFLKELSTSAAMVQTGVFVSLGVVGVWLMAANRVGKLHAHLSTTNEIIQ